MVETDWIPAIPIVSHFKYLGVEMYPSLELIERKNFKFFFKGIKEDLAWCGDLTLSLSGRISLIKMKILPRINFYAGMLPLPTPQGYWDRISYLRLYMARGTTFYPFYPILSSTKIVGQVV